MHRLNHLTMHTYVNRTRTVEDKMSQREIIALLKENNALLAALLQKECCSCQK